MGEPYRAVTAFDTTYLKQGRHIVHLLMDDRVAMSIGRVVAQWAHFETTFNIALDALLAAFKREEPGWKLLSFRKRKRLFRELVRKIPSEHEEAKRAILALTNVAAELNWKRNVIVHGDYAVTVHEISNAVYRAAGVHKGKRVTIPLEHGVLTKMWHDIGQLAGDFIQTFGRIGEVEGGLPILSCAEILRVHAESKRRTPPA